MDASPRPWTLSGNPRYFRPEQSRDALVVVNAEASGTVYREVSLTTGTTVRHSAPLPISENMLVRVWKADGTAAIITARDLSGGRTRLLQLDFSGGATAVQARTCVSDQQIVPQDDQVYWVGARQFDFDSCAPTGLDAPGPILDAGETYLIAGLQSGPTLLSHDQQHKIGGNRPLLGRFRVAFQKTLASGKIALCWMGPPSYSEDCAGEFDSIDNLEFSPAEDLIAVTTRGTVQIRRLDSPAGLVWSGSAGSIHLGQHLAALMSSSGATWLRVPDGTPVPIVTPAGAFPLAVLDSGYIDRTPDGLTFVPFVMRSS